MIKGCVPVDADTFDIPAIIEVADQSFWISTGATVLIRPPPERQCRATTARGGLAAVPI